MVVCTLILPKRYQSINHTSGHGERLSEASAVTPEVSID